MKKLLIIAFLFIGIIASAQRYVAPSGLPAKLSAKWYEFATPGGYILLDTMAMFKSSDTLMKPIYPALKFAYGAFYQWDSTKWTLVGSGGSGGGNFYDTAIQITDTSFYLTKPSLIRDTIEIIGVSTTADTNFIRNQYTIRETKSAKFDSANTTTFITAGGAELSGNIFIPSRTHGNMSYGDAVVKNRSGTTIFDFTTAGTSTFADSAIKLSNITAGTFSLDSIATWNASTKRIGYESPNLFIWNQQASVQTANFLINGTGNAHNLVVNTGGTFAMIAASPFHQVVFSTTNITSANFAQEITPANGNVAVALYGDATLDFGSTLAGASTDLTVNVPNAADGDPVAVGVPNASTLANGVFTAWVSTAGVVTVRFTNTNLVAALDPASGSFNVTVFKHN